MSSHALRKALPPVSIRNSFAEGLPDLPLGRHDPEAEISEGAPATQNMPPPTIAFPRHEDQRWYKLGVKSLEPHSKAAMSFVGQIAAVDKNVPGGEEALDFARAFAEDKYFVPESEENIYHANEADVVRSASLYLIHPVMEALTAYPRYHRSIATKAEDINGATRTDLTFYIPSTGTNAARPFAVAEYKKRETFQAEDFNHKNIISSATPPSWGTDKEEIAAKLAQIIESKPCGPDGEDELREAVAAFEELVQECKKQSGVDYMHSMTSIFDGNALKLIKQAASYMVTDRVRYVILFNWDRMVLCYFPWLDISKSQKDLREEFRVIKRASRNVQVKDVSPYPVEVDVYETNDPNLRLALLAFLQHAWEETWENKKVS